MLSTQTSMMSRTRHSVRNRLNTIDDPNSAHQTARLNTSIYKTVKDPVDEAGEAYLDPRTLYRAKKNNNVAVTNNAIDILRLQTPAALINKKLSTFQSRLSQRHARGVVTLQRLNHPRIAPLKGSPENKMSQSNTRELSSDVAMVASQGPSSTTRRTLVSKVDQKMNQTLMSYHNRKHSHLKQLPMVSPLASSAKGSRLIAGEESTSRQQIYQTLQQSNPMEFSAFRRGMVDAQRSYDPTIHTANQQRVSPQLNHEQVTNPASRVDTKNDTLHQPQPYTFENNVTVSTPATNRTVGRGQMHMTQPSWRVGYGSLRVQTGNDAVVPKTSNMPQRTNMMYLMNPAANQYDSKNSYTNKTQDPMTQKRRSLNRPNEKAISPEQTTVNELFRQSATDFNGGGTTNEVVNTTRQANRSSQKSTKPKVGYSLLSIEQESAVFMSRPSDPQLLSNQMPKQAATPPLNSPHNNQIQKQSAQFDIPRKPMQKKRFESSHAVVETVESKDALPEKGELKPSRHTPTEIHKAKLDITPVPMAIAAKSSKVSIKMTSRKNSSKMLRNSKSFIDTTNADRDKARLKKLASFNDDIREVVNQKKSNGVASKETMGGKRFQQVNGSSEQAKSSRDAHSGEFHMHDSVPKMGPTHIAQTSLQQQCQKTVTFPLDSCNWLISNETIRKPNSPKDGNETNNLATHTQTSVETFHNQKMQESKVPRLDQITTRNKNDLPSPVFMQSSEVNPLKQRKKIQNSGNNKYLSTMTLTMSQIDQAEKARSKQPSPGRYHTKGNVSPTPFEEEYMMDTIAPMIIQTAAQEKRAVHTKNPPKTQTTTPRPVEKVPQEPAKGKGKMTLEQKTLQQIANLEDNNSIIIDCNALVKDGDGANAQLGTATNSKQGQDERLQTHLNQSVLTQVSRKDDSRTMNQKSGKAFALEKPKPPLLGNPLLTSQLLGPQGKRTENMGLAKEHEKNKDMQNKDIKQVTGKDQNIGVGSVVLHLRKQRQPLDGSEESLYKSNNEQRIALQTMNTSEDLDLASLGTREMASPQILSSDENFNTTIKAVQKMEEGTTFDMQNQRLVKQVSSNSPGNRGAVKPVSKHVGVLRQKPFSKFVQPQKNVISKKKLGSPRVHLNQVVAKGTNTNQQRTPRRGAGEPYLGRQQNLTLELVGTQKAQVMQQPRMPKYDVMNKYKKSPRYNSLEPSQANFFIPHYNYFGGEYREVTAENFGETLQPGQMHQLITLQNGQMMIRRVDMSIAPKELISIDLANMIDKNAKVTSYPLDGFTRRPDPVNFAQSPTTRLGANHEDNTPTKTPPSPKNTIPLLPDKEANRSPAPVFNKDKASIGAETICVTELSNTSFQHIGNEDSRENVSRLPLQLRISNNKVVQGQGELIPEGSTAEKGFNSQNDNYKDGSRKTIPHRKNVTQHAVDCEKSGEQIIKDDNSQEEQLLLSDENKRRITSQAPSMKGSTNQVLSYGIIQQAQQLNKISDNYLKIIEPNALHIKDENASNSSDRDSKGRADDTSGLYAETPDQSFPHSPTLVASNNSQPFQLDLSSMQTKYNNNPSVDQNNQSSVEGSASKRVIFNRNRSGSKKAQQPLIKVRLTHDSFQTNASEDRPLKAKLEKAHESGEYSGKSGLALTRIQNTYESPLETPKEEDPIIFAKKMQKKHSPRNTTNDQYRKDHTDLKPWDDKPDPAMRQKSKETVKKSNPRNITNKSGSSVSKVQTMMDSLERIKIPKLVQNSVNSLASSGSIQEKTSGSNKVTARKSQQKEPIKQSRIKTKGNAMLVNDKARQSLREIQEREMNAIVFDDTQTPKFRPKNPTNEDQQLEEILNNPLSPSDPQGNTLPLKGNGDAQSLEQIPEDQKVRLDTSGGELLGEDDDMGETDEQYRARIQDEARGAVLLKNKPEMVALQTADLNLSTSLYEEVSEKNPNGRQSPMQEVPVEVQIETQLDDEMDQIYSKYGKLIRGKTWKAPIPAEVGEAVGSHINDAHINSYFAKYQQD